MITQLLPEHFPWDLLLLADPSREVIERYIFGSVVYGLDESGEIAGVVVVTPLSLTSWEIRNLAVKPEYQGRGFAKSLIVKAIQTCRARGATEVWIGTGNSSVRQLGLYQKLGFRMVEIDGDFFTRNYPEPIVEDGIQCRDMVRLVHRVAP